MRFARACCTLVLLALSVLIPFTGAALATPFTILPNGDLEIDVAFTTQGVLSCNRGQFGLPPDQACSGSGTNSIVFGSGANTATLTFFGVNATVSNIAGTKSFVPLGVITGSATPGFTFPTIHPQQALVSLGLSLIQSSPAPGIDETTWTFGLGGGGTQLPLQGPSGPFHLELPIGAQPPAYHYGSLIYSLDSLFSIPSDGNVVVGAELGAVPEPTTLLLFGTTMAGLGVARWRQRRRKQQQP
jgi:PEP-CTERM motif